MYIYVGVQGLAQEDEIHAVPCSFKIIVTKQEFDNGSGRSRHVRKMDDVEVRRVYIDEDAERKFTNSEVSTQ